ncbi:hypothetical protein [uncultured Croceitalea sp.]|uniref:hypothetical protein n=1 Tax=uncultured Croceitalea sp. TaxID=1798908 RepID=UPI003305F9CC
MFKKKLITKRPKKTPVKQLISMIMVAIMLGVSNIILEENRSVNDTRVKTEIIEMIDNDYTQ